MPASPESSPPDFEPSRYTDDDLYRILRNGNQNPSLTGWVSAELERRRNAREDVRTHHVARTARAAAWAAGFSALGALITAAVNVLRLFTGQ
jgi:hypothetical protein